jgi:flagellin
MAFTINNNTLSQGIPNRTAKNQRLLGDAYRKIGSGKAVSSAHDNAALLAIATRMSSEIRGINQSSRTANDGISLLQVADGGLANISDAQQRIRELAVQAGNGALNDSDRANIQLEVDQLQAQIGSIVNDTAFNGKQLLASGQTLDFQVGPDNGEALSFTLTDFSGAGAFGAVDVTTQANAQAALATMDTDMDRVTQERASIGGITGELETIINNLANRGENSAAAHSQMVDADMAQLSAEKTRAGILTQAGISVQIQANQSAANAYQLVAG